MKFSQKNWLADVPDLALRKSPKNDSSGRVNHSKVDEELNKSDCEEEPSSSKVSEAL